MRLAVALRVWAFASCLVCSYGTGAQADEQLTPLAAEGEWAAVSHSDSITDPPDVCMALDASKGFGIRVDNTGDLEFRLANPSWSLPSDVTGSLAFAVNGHNYSIDITGNTSNAVSASVTQDQLIPIITDMEKATSMSVKAGSASQIQIPLDGTTAVLTAFLTCAGIQTPTPNTGGANPFAGAPASQ